MPEPTGLPRSYHTQRLYDADGTQAPTVEVRRVPPADAELTGRGLIVQADAKNLPLPDESVDLAVPPPAGRPRDGNGRFLAKRTSMIPPMSAALAQALLDASAEAWRAENATRTATGLVAAVEFGDRVDHGEDGS